MRDPIILGPHLVPLMVGNFPEKALEDEPSTSRGFANHGTAPSEKLAKNVLG